MLRRTQSKIGTPFRFANFGQFETEQGTTHDAQTCPGATARAILSAADRRPSLQTPTPTLFVHS